MIFNKATNFQGYEIEFTLWQLRKKITVGLVIVGPYIKSLSE